MIPAEIVREKTGLSQRQLTYMRRLGLMPYPTRMPTAGCRGSAYGYPDTVFTRIHMITFLQGHGFTLAQVGQAAKGTPFECLDTGPKG